MSHNEKIESAVTMTNIMSNWASSEAWTRTPQSSSSQKMAGERKKNMKKKLSDSKYNQQVVISKYYYLILSQIHVHISTQVGTSEVQCLN